MIVLGPHHFIVDDRVERYRQSMTAEGFDHPLASFGIPGDHHFVHEIDQRDIHPRLRGDDRLNVPQGRLE